MVRTLQSLFVVIDLHAAEERLSVSVLESECTSLWVRGEMMGRVTRRANG